MKIVSSIGGALAALMLSVVSAAAVTVTMTHTGTVSADDILPTDVPTPGGPTIRHGDAFTLTYDILLDETTVVGTCDINPLDCYNEVVNIDAPAQLSFSSGYSTTITNSVVDLFVSKNATGVSPYLSLSGDTPDGGFFAFEALPALPLDFLSLPPSSLLTGLNASSGEDFYFDIGPSAIGYSVDCFGNCIFLPTGPVTTVATIPGVTPDPIKPIDPVTPVPVPAPFLMLGVALAGLIGFGRRKPA